MLPSFICTLLIRWLVAPVCLSNESSSIYAEVYRHAPILSIIRVQSTSSKWGQFTDLCWNQFDPSQYILEECMGSFTNLTLKVPHSTRWGMLLFYRRTGGIGWLRWHGSLSMCWSHHPWKVHDKREVPHLALNNLKTHHFLGRHLILEVGEREDLSTPKRRMVSNLLQSWVLLWVIGRGLWILT